MLLRAFFAAAVALQLPSLPEASASTLMDELCKISLNGMPPLSVSVKPVADGWYCVVAEFGRERGLYICRPGLQKHPLYKDMFGAQLEHGDSKCTFSIYVKPQLPDYKP